MGLASSAASKWKWCALVSMAMVLLSLLPQIHLWLGRGRDWHGAYVSPQGDEALYSAYINALIEGRPRKNDPFGGRDNVPNAPLPETTFSIQFVPAYLLALPARTFGLSAATAFIALSAMAAFIAAVSVFALLNYMTRDAQVAGAGTLFVLCMGCIVGRYGLFNTFFDVGVPALPFLRRYQPAVAFPLFFVFQLMVWQALTSRNRRVVRLATVVAGCSLAVLIFSYLYLWTGAVAWLACALLLWLYFRPQDYRRPLAVLAAIVCTAGAALVPYIYLLSQRAVTLDEHQTLISSHRPDLLRAHEILGAAIIIALIIGVRRGKIPRTEPRMIYAASLGLLPFVVFNQQVLTGKLMQSFHYEIFVVNYSTLVGLFITLALFFSFIPRRLLVWITALSLSWAFIVVALPGRLVFIPQSARIDQTIPVLLRLQELSRQDGTFTDLRSTGQASTLVFSPDVSLIRSLPTWTSQGTLLDPGGVDFGSATREERKRFFYMHLYYAKIEKETVRQLLNGLLADSALDLYARSVIFGHERVTPALGLDFKPIQPEEVDQEADAYDRYANSFSRDEARKRPISYAVVPTNDAFDFSNLDRWYERNAGERVGDYLLFSLKPRR